MLKKHNIRGRDGGELHREHLIIGGHPCRQNDLVPQGTDITDVLATYYVPSASDLDDDTVGAKGIVPVLEVEAEVRTVNSVFKEDIADRAIYNVIDGCALYKRPSGQSHRRANIDKYRPSGRY
jgi:hypothetical protein